MAILRPPAGPIPVRALLAGLTAASGTALGLHLALRLTGAGPLPLLAIPALLLLPHAAAVLRPPAAPLRLWQPLSRRPALLRLLRGLALLLLPALPSLPLPSGSPVDRAHLLWLLAALLLPAAAPRLPGHREAPLWVAGLIAGLGLIAALPALLNAPLLLLLPPLLDLLLPAPAPAPALPAPPAPDRESVV